MSFENNYMLSAQKQFLLYKTLARKAMEQVEAPQLFLAVSENSNSIAVIVKHMHGNMVSRWTDFLTTDGEKVWRERDGEFENDIRDKAHLIHLWEEGWNCLFSALDSLTNEQFDANIFIRGESHSVVDAINRQLTHYAYHTGQIVFAAKQLKEGSWESLSIPRKKS